MMVMMVAILIVAERLNLTSPTGCRCLCHRKELSRMRQTICDRCGKETKKPTWITLKVGNFFYRTEKLFDLCPKCLDEFGGFMKQEKEPTPSANEISSEE